VKFSYDHPLTYTLGPKPLNVVKVKHGVTEVSLSDGRILRLSLHIDGIKPNEQNSLDIAYQVITELMTEPAIPIMDVHEAIQ
jgi:hypothetical protein